MWDKKVSGKNGRRQRVPPAMCRLPKRRPVFRTCLFAQALQCVDNGF